MTTIVSAVVPGPPRTQGSKVAAVAKGRKPWVRDADKRTKPWRTQVATALKESAAAVGWEFTSGACSVHITLYLPRGKSVRRPWPSARGSGDADKYARAVLDAITEAGVWADDAQCVFLDVRKRYAHDPAQVGTRISVRKVLANPCS
jgi:Holliday junction resolvase RusA-like endonuclease